MMNMRSAFLGWCCVYSTSKSIIKFIKEKIIIEFFPPITTFNESLDPINFIGSTYFSEKRKMNDKHN